MQTTMRPRLMNDATARAAVAGAILALGLVATAATAQTTAPAATSAKPGTVEAAPPTNAQLQEEIRGLREQIAQMQQAQKTAGATDKPKGGMAMGKQGKKKCKQAMNTGMGMGMGMDMGMAKDKGCPETPDAGGAKDAPDKPMQKGGMGMEKDDSMGTPSPEGH